MLDEEWPVRVPEGAVDTEALPWLDFGLIPGGAAIKPLRFSAEGHTATFLLRIHRGAAGEGPLHRHFGGVEYFVLDGGEDLPPGLYIKEEGGFTHREPPLDADTVMLSFNHAPLQAFTDEDEPYPPLGDEKLFALLAREAERADPGPVAPAGEGRDGLQRG